MAPSFTFRGTYQTKVIVTFPEEDREVFCSLIHISSVEMLQRA